MLRNCCPSFLGFLKCSMLASRDSLKLCKTPMCVPDDLGTCGGWLCSWVLCPSLCKLQVHRFSVEKVQHVTFLRVLEQCQDLFSS